MLREIKSFFFQNFYSKYLLCKMISVNSKTFTHVPYTARVISAVCNMCSKCSDHVPSIENVHSSSTVQLSNLLHCTKKSNDTHESYDAKIYPYLEHVQTIKIVHCAKNVHFSEHVQTSKIVHCTKNVHFSEHVQVQSSDNFYCTENVQSLGTLQNSEIVHCTPKLHLSEPVQISGIVHCLKNTDITHKAHGAKNVHCLKRMLCTQHFHCTESVQDENCDPRFLTSFLNSELSRSDLSGTTSARARPRRDSLMTLHENQQGNGSRRSNSDWTEDLPPAGGCSFVNKKKVIYTDFNWKIEANHLEITGFFTHKNNKDKSEIKQRIAQRCFGDEVTEKSNPNQV